MYKIRFKMSLFIKYLVIATKHVETLHYIYFFDFYFLVLPL